jgi:hypothetical protein
MRQGMGFRARLAVVSAVFVSTVVAAGIAFSVVVAGRTARAHAAAAAAPADCATLRHHGHRTEAQA